MKNKKIFLQFLLFNLINIISVSLIADIPGTLDRTFNSQGPIPGVVRTKVSSNRDLAQAITVQQDKKIIAAGLAFNGLIDNIALVRYNFDGSRDSSFGNNGIVTTEIPNGNSYAYDVTLDQQERIIVVGSAQSEKGNYEFVVVRYNQNGSLDQSFGNNGIVLTDFEKRFDQANKVLVQPDGKIVVVGLARPAEGNPAVALARYNDNGSLDSTFGDNGQVLTMLDDNTHQALGLGLQEDGKIVISGFILEEKSESKIIVIRYNTDGSIDKTFAKDSVSSDNNISADAESSSENNISQDMESSSDSNTVGTNVNNEQSIDKIRRKAGVAESQFEPYSFGTSLVIQPDGKIAVASNVITKGFNHAVPAVVRYNSDGSLDTTFGNNGIALIDIGKRTEIFDIVRTSEGNLIIGGFVIEEKKETQPEPLTDALLISFTSQGQLDTSFNPNGPIPGVTITSLGSDITSRSFSMALAQDEKIVIAGGSSEELNRTHSDFLVARFIGKTSSFKLGKMSLLVRAIIKKYCNILKI